MMLFSSATNNSNETSNGTLVTDHVSFWKPFPILFWTFLVLLDLIIIFGNAFFCWLFIRYKNLRHNSNFFVLSLAIGDFFVGLSVPPCEYCAVLTTPPSECQLFCGGVLSFNMAASVMNLTLIAYERVLAIKFPFRYHSGMTRRRVYRLIALVWLSAPVCSILPFTWNLLAPHSIATDINHVYFITVYSLIFLIGILIHVAYYVIIKEAKEKARSAIHQGGRHGDSAGLKICMVLATVFVVCWIPQAFVELSIEFRWLETPLWLLNTTYFILLINPCLDPILYAYYKQEFRASAKLQLGRWLEGIPWPLNRNQKTKNNNGIIRRQTNAHNSSSV